MKDKNLMLFPGKCPLNRETCNECGQYEVCIEFYKIGYEPKNKPDGFQQKGN